jgi:hypothetical protein
VNGGGGGSSMGIGNSNEAMQVLDQFFAKSWQRGGGTGVDGAGAGSGGGGSGSGGGSGDLPSWSACYVRASDAVQTEQGGTAKGGTEKGGTGPSGDQTIATTGLQQGQQTGGTSSTQSPTDQGNDPLSADLDLLWHQIHICACLLNSEVGTNRVTFHGTHHMACSTHCTHIVCSRAAHTVRHALRTAYSTYGAHSYRTHRARTDMICTYELI